MRCWQALILLLYVIPALGQEIVWHDQKAPMEIGKHLLVLEDSSGTLRISDVVKKPAYAFKPSQQSILNFGFTDIDVWLKFTIDNPGNDSLVLVLDHAFIPSATLYHTSPAGDIDSVQSGFTVPLYQKQNVAHAQVFNIQRPNTTYYLRLKPIVHAIPVFLQEKAAYTFTSSREKMIFGVYCGILLFVILFHIFLFFFLKRIYYLSYSVLVFLYLLTSALVMEGYAVYFFPTVNLMYWYKIIPVLDMPALLFYCITFFNLRTTSKRLHRVAVGACIFFLTYLVVLHFLPLLPVLLINQVFALGVFVLATTIGIDAWKKGNSLGKYFAFAYSLWFVLISVEVVYMQTGWPEHFTAVSYVSTAVFIEAILLAVLQAKRFQWDREADANRELALKLDISKMEQDFQTEILNARLEIQEQTFRNISQEIHDNIVHELALAKMNLSVLGERYADGDQEQIMHSKKLVAAAIDDLRDLAHSLKGHRIAEAGLENALRYELEILERSSNYTTSFEVKGEVFDLDPQSELILFRILQEVLQNILKHAKATCVKILMEYQKNALLVKVSDDGKGFDTVILKGGTNAGMGISNIRERAALINATLNVRSAPGTGTDIEIISPGIHNNATIAQ